MDPESSRILAHDYGMDNAVPPMGRKGKPNGARERPGAGEATVGVLAEAPPQHEVSTLKIVQLIIERGIEPANVPSSRNPMTPATSDPTPAGRKSGVAETSSAARTATVPRDLPGAELVAAGIEALGRGEPTMEALLVMVGARRMRAAGLDVPPGLPLESYPEHALYLAVAARHPEDAHSRYNALVRRLVSFERALEAVGIPSERATRWLKGESQP